MSKKDTDNFFLKEKDFKSLEGHKLELSYMDAVEPKDLNSIKQFIICFSNNINAKLSAYCYIAFQFI